MWALRFRVFVFVGLFMLLFSAFCWAQDSQDTSYYIMTEGEYQSLKADCEQLKIDLQNAKDSLNQSEQTRKQLEQSLTDYQSKIDDLSSKAESLEISLILSERESLMLKAELETLQKSFKAYTKEVNSRLWRARIKWFLAGLAIGAGVGYCASR
jgi:peptidoglycan hydrolase CwlO-like protein